MILDLVEYLTGYSVREYARVQIETQLIEQRRKKFNEKMKEEKLKDGPHFKESVF